MPTTAVSAQRTKFFIEGTPGTALVIAGITKAAQAVCTASNTLVVGDVVDFGDVTGMPEIKGLLGIVVARSGTDFTVNIDSSGFAAVGTGGTAAPKTWKKVANVKDYNGFDGTAGETDATNFDSEAKEFLPGLQDFGQVGFTMDVDDADVGQIALRANKTAAVLAAFRIVLRNGKQRVWRGFVKKFSESASSEATVKASVDVRISGAVVFG